MSDQVFVGEFPVDPDTIVDSPLAPAKQELELKVEKAERKTAETTGNVFISLTIAVVDFPGNSLWQGYFLTSKAIAARSSVISWKKFLDKVKLPYSTSASELVNLKFIGTLKHEGSGDEAQLKLESVVGPVVTG